MGTAESPVPLADGLPRADGELATVVIGDELVTGVVGDELVTGVEGDELVTGVVGDCSTTLTLTEEPTGARTGLPLPCCPWAVKVAVGGEELGIVTEHSTLMLPPGLSMTFAIVIELVLTVGVVAQPAVHTTSVICAVDQTVGRSRYTVPPLKGTPAVNTSVKVWEVPAVAVSGDTVSM
jgi:hypothetical protein